MEFIRFQNSPANKHIGFKLEHDKETVFKVLLKSIADFTIPGSQTMIFFRNCAGQIRVKRYEKIQDSNFYINGHLCYTNFAWESIFPSVKSID